MIRSSALRALRAKGRRRVDQGFTEKRCANAYLVVKKGKRGCHVEETETYFICAIPCQVFVLERAYVLAYDLQQSHGHKRGTAQHHQSMNGWACRCATTNVHVMTREGSGIRTKYLEQHDAKEMRD